MSENESVSDKLKSLGMSIGRNISSPARSPVTTYRDITDFVAGFDHQTIYGPVFIAQTSYDENYLQGNSPLWPNSNLEMIARFANLSTKSVINPEELLFLDTETSGLSGGSGTFVFLIGIGLIYQNKMQVYQLFLRDPSEESSLLAALTHYVSSFKNVVTFNGKSFDIPILNGRFIMQGLTSPFIEQGHIDLLHLSRSIWRNRLEDRSLKNLENQILDFHRTEDEVPGWMVPELYLDYLKTRDAEPLKGVFYHNLMDIVSLAGLLSHLGDLLADPLEKQETNSLDLMAVAKLYERAGKYEEAAKIYKKSLQHGLPEDFYIQALMRYANICAKQKNYAGAISLWTQAAEFNYIEAEIELSKFYEHHEKNYELARFWCDKALVWMQKVTKNDPSLQDSKNLELLHRYERVMRKILSTKPN